MGSSGWTNLTKVELARVIVLALYNMKEMPRPDHPNVVKLAKRSKPHLISAHKLAIRALESIGRSA